MDLQENSSALSSWSTKTNAGWLIESIVRSGSSGKLAGTIGNFLIIGPDSIKSERKDWCKNSISISMEWFNHDDSL